MGDEKVTLGVPPKRYRTSYMAFYLEKLPKLRSANAYAGTSVKELTKIAAEEWRNMSDKNKKKYEDAQEKDRKRWEKENDMFQRKGFYVAAA